MSRQKSSLKVSLIQKESLIPKLRNMIVQSSLLFSRGELPENKCHFLNDYKRVLLFIASLPDLGNRYERSMSSVK